MRPFFFTLVVVLCLASLSLGAEQPSKIPRVGLLAGGAFPGSPGAPRSRWSPYYAVVEGLHDLGWEVGNTIILEPKYAAGKLDRLPAMARELVDMKVDVILTMGSNAVGPAVEATRTIPIVMIAGSSDPVGDGLAASLAHPGGNVTGVTWSPSPELAGKAVAILKEIVPGISRVALLTDGPIRPTALRTWNDISERLQMKLQRFEAYDRADLQPSLEAISRGRAQALYVGMSGATYSYRNEVTALALQRRIPTVSTARELPEAGGLLSYGPNTAAMFRRGAWYIDKILKGTKPGDLPIEQPSSFNLVINLRTARALGLSIPSSLLQQADEVIE